MADGVGKGAALGGFKGASLGAKLGSVLPGPGTLIGAGAGALIGGIAGGAGAKKTADEREKGLQLPGLEDPTQTSRRLEVERIAKNIQAGTDSATQTALNEGKGTTAAAQSRISRVTGGNSGATVDALLKSQRAGQSAANQSIAQGQTRLPFFMNLGQQIANRQEQRKLELDLLGRAQTSAETAQEGKERNVNFNAALASGQLGKNFSGQGERIRSLLNQGIGKAQGDIAPMASPEIGGGGFNGMPELPPNIGDIAGGAGALPTEGIDLGGTLGIGG